MIKGRRCPLKHTPLNKKESCLPALVGIWAVRDEYRFVI